MTVEVSYRKPGKKSERKLARQHPALQTPLIDGDRATFLWDGANAPKLTGDFADWEPEKALELKREKPRVWSITLQFPPDAYIEYSFIREDELCLDPHNPNRVFNGIDADNNYFYMPSGGPTPLAKRRRGIAHGWGQRFLLTSQWVVRGNRSVYFVQPDVQEPCPLLVVFDGPDYRKRAGLVNIVENLMSEGRIQPLALAFLANGGQARAVEYSCNDASLEFILESVIPVAQGEMNLIDLQESPGAYGVLGASMGGLISLYTALRAPQVFGKVISQSGAFFPESVVFDLVHCSGSQAVDIWMDVGRYERLLEDNRRMFAWLQDRGYPATYREYNGGHNYSAWRDDVWRGLETLFHPVVSC